MRRQVARICAYLFCVLTLALTGCASVTYAPGGGGDIDRLNNAITTDDVGFIRAAIESRSISPNQRISTEGYPDGAPLLAIAARAASLEVMRYLISAGADVNGRTPVGETPLMLAAFFSDEAEQASGRGGERHERAVRLLVSAGADLENLPHHYTPLAYAAYQGKERVSRFLIERGARVNADARNGITYINTPLMMAAIQGHESVARVLLRAGADADVRVHNGHTAAEFAAKYNHSQLARLLQCAQRDYARSTSQCGQVLGFDARERYSAAHP
jgi:ankyrin repeat protein